MNLPSATTIKVTEGREEENARVCIPHRSRALADRASHYSTSFTYAHVFYMGRPFTLTMTAFSDPDPDPDPVLQSLPMTP
jgi:hypothetical protein